MKSDFLFCPFLISGVLMCCLNSQVTPALFPIGPGPTPSGRNYKGDNTRRTWQQAKDFCESQTTPSQMLLATIDFPAATPTEYSFLNSHWSQQFNGWYWTAARTPRTADIFRWDGDPAGNKVDAASFGPRIEWAEPGACVAFYSKEGDSHGIVMPCDSPNGLTLCMHG